MCRQEQLLISTCSFLLPFHLRTGLSMMPTALIWRSWILDHATPPPCPRSSSPSSCSRCTGRSTRGCETTSPSSWSSWKRTRWTRGPSSECCLSACVTAVCWLSPFPASTQVKVLHNQLILFHNAIAAYYAGNQQQLEQTLKQFHIKLKMPGGDSPSWLEEH